MRLLVSVRSPSEVAAAIAGGADIIDAKEPSRGSLGAVSSGVLREILIEIPASNEVSVALGDFRHSDDVCSAIAALPLVGPPPSAYVKLGFSGVSSKQQIAALLRAAATAALRHPARPRVVAVAYADARLTGCSEPETVLEAAAESGAAGMLLDTEIKTTGHLFSWMVPERVRRLFAELHRMGLIAAAAGGLGPAQIQVAEWTGPDIIGVRGAACVGGRQGRLSPSRVRRLRQMLSQPASDFVQGTFLPT